MDLSLPNHMHEERLEKRVRNRWRRLISLFLVGRAGDAPHGVEVTKSLTGVNYRNQVN